jgi:GNAT superfamily N-acetyltransferase
MPADAPPVIQAVCEDDIAVVHAMIMELADNLGYAHEAVATETDLHQALFGPRPRAEVVVAWLDQQAAGFALFYNNYSTFRGQCGVHLEDLYVRAAFRGHGLGRKLLAHMARLTRERGCGRLEWWALTADERANAFYRRVGATVQDEWSVYRLKGRALADLAAEA